MEYNNLKTGKTLKTTTGWNYVIPMSNGFILLSALKLDFQETILNLFAENYVIL